MIILGSSFLIVSFIGSEIVCCSFFKVIIWSFNSFISLSLFCVTITPVIPDAVVTDIPVVINRGTKFALI